MPLVTVAQENFTWQRFIKFWEGHYAWHEPGIFFPCAAWQAAGALDESFYYCMEPVLFGAGITIRLVVYLDAALAYFRIHGTNKTMSGNKDALLDEKCAIVEKYMHLLAPEDRPSLGRFWFISPGGMLRRGNCSRHFTASI